MEQAIERGLFLEKETCYTISASLIIGCSMNFK